MLISCSLQDKIAQFWPFPGGKWLSGRKWPSKNWPKNISYTKHHSLEQFIPNKLSFKPQSYALCQIPAQYRETLLNFGHFLEENGFLAGNGHLKYGPKIPPTHSIIVRNNSYLTGFLSYPNPKHHTHFLLNIGKHAHF